MKQNMKRVLFLLAALALLLAACGGENAKTADLQQVYGKMEEQLALPEMLVLSPEQFQRMTGIDGANCPQLVAAVCQEGLRVDEIWLIEAADEAAAQELEKLMESHVTQICAETENYLPDQYAVAKEARILRIGSYVGLFLSPDAAAMEEIFRQGFEG